MEPTPKLIPITLQANVGDTFFTVDTDRYHKINKWIVIGIEIIHRIGYQNVYDNDEKCLLPDGYTYHIRYRLLSDDKYSTYWTDSDFKKTKIYKSVEDILNIVQEDIFKAMSSKDSK